MTRPPQKSKHPRARNRTPAKPHRRTRPPPKGRLRQRLARAALWTLGGFVALSLSATALFRWLPPPASAVMVQRAIGQGAGYEYRWTPLAEIAPAAALAVVAAEDQKFPRHFGFDLGEIRAAINASLDGGRLRGASTISQQVAKNLFLWEGRAWLRKGLEAWFTLLIETLWSKRRILEVYLNIAEMGPGLYGVQAASQGFFGISAQDLSPSQAALLAAVLPNPRTYRADAPSPYVRKRQRWIIGQMTQLGGTAYLDAILPARPDRGAR